MLVEGIDILLYIPQRPPFVYIDRLLEATERKVTGQFIITGDNILVDNRVLTEAGIIESIAQTIAAGAGFMMKLDQSDVKIGYIAAIRNLQIYRLPVAGEILTSTILPINRIFDITISQAEAFVGNEKIAECEMRIFTKEEGVCLVTQ